MTHWRRLTIFLGAVPATLLSVPAVLGVVYGALFIVGTVVGAETGLLALGAFLFIWGGLGVYGTISLWAVGLGLTRGWAKAGLAIGTIAILPLPPLWILDQPTFNVPSLVVVPALLLPPAFALGWLVYFRRQTSFRSDEPVETT